jgi:Flp pilus assembly protein TadD
METIRAGTVTVLGLSLLMLVPAQVAAQAKPRQAQSKALPPAAPRTQADSDYTPALADAETALDKKNYARAEKLLKQVLAENSKNARAWFYLGSVYAAGDRKTEAIAALEKAVALKPKVFESNLNLGLLLASAGKNEQAANHLRIATQLNPSNKKTADQEIAYAWISLGRVLEQTHPALALDAFAQAARLTPKSPEPHLEAAQLLEKQKKYGDAEREYQQALMLTPKSKEALAGLVSVYIEQKRLTDAEAALRRYIDAEPANLAAQKQLGRIYGALGRPDEAIAVFNKVLSVSPADVEAKRELADLASDGEKYDVAEKLYRELVQATPQDAGTHLALGTVLMKQRKFPEAESELLQALKLDPKLAEGYGNLAIVAAENKQYELALKALEARSKLMPDDAITYYLRATCYDHLKAFPQASENYRKFLESAEGKFPTQEWQARHRLLAIEPKK